MAENKKVNYLHLIYLCIIFLIVLGFMIVCFCKGRISENAFQNVSFAATVASILLALISIVLSMNAANTTSENLMSMSKVEQKLSYSLKRLHEISKVLKRTENKIDKLPIAERLQPNQYAVDASKLQRKSQAFLMVGSSLDESRKYEDAAISELCNELSLVNIKRDIRVKGIPGLFFDASAYSHGYIYLIEVKLCSTPSQAREQYSRFKIQVAEVLRKFDTNNLLIYLLFVCKNNNSDVIRNDVREISGNNSEFGTVFYNLSDIENNK